MNFLRSFLASLLAVIVGFLVAIPLIFIVLTGIFASLGQKEEVTVNPGSVIHMKLNSPIVENQEPSPFDFNFEDLGSFGAPTSSMGLYQIIESIEKAKTDANIKGIYLDLGGVVQTGWANLTTIREALVDFKSSGKFIYAYSEIFSESTYYVSSVADSVFMAPEGILEFNGFTSNPVFFKGMFDKLEVQPKVFKVGTYKSAVEPFIRKDMSEANRLQTEKYLDVMWNSFISDVSLSREISKEELNQIANQVLLSRGSKALDNKLVDALVYNSDFRNRLKAAADKESTDKLNTISFKKYIKVPGAKKRVSKNKIAVVFAEGTIGSGKSTDGVVGSESIVKALRKAREDANVKAIVLRVNSPGGSALASDMIAEEVRLCSQAKPIVASMGDVAASGGYYISAPTDRIFARENTITGSIGIFGILWEVGNALEENIGLTFDEVETHAHSNIGNPAFPIDGVESAWFQSNVEQGYGDFVRVVKNGRGFADSAAVDAIAQGRVWAGSDAKGINLVDEYGDLQDAIRYVAEEVGVADDYRVDRLPGVKNPFEKLIQNMTETYQDKLLENHPLSKEIKRMEEIKRMIPGSGIYMLMPYQINIQ